MATCFLCKSSKKDDIQYGQFLKNDHFGVHTFCLYLSSNLPQRGEDNEGFLGFLYEDIKKEVKRISLLKCFYCGKKYANVGCCNIKCQRAFHFVCGLENNAENYFCDDFRSFCNKHARQTQRPPPDETCLICYEKIVSPGMKFVAVKNILTPCCQNGWFHKPCLQKFANTAGYFFKCPLCNDTKTFREMLPSQGIFILNQDAAWELEPDAFAELLERPNECVAQPCKNRGGRTECNEATNPFILCFTCGSKAMHRQCLNNHRKYFRCTDCTLAELENDSGRESLNLNINNNDNEDEYIDVCKLSDKEDLEMVTNLMPLVDKTTENNRDFANRAQDSDSSSDANATFSKSLKKMRSIKHKMRIRTDSEDSESPQTSKGFFGKGRRLGNKKRSKQILNNEKTKPRSNENDNVLPNVITDIATNKAAVDTHEKENKLHLSKQTHRRQQRSDEEMPSTSRNRYKIRRIEDINEDVTSCSDTDNKDVIKQNKRIKSIHVNIGHERIKSRLEGEKYANNSSDSDNADKTIFDHRRKTQALGSQARTDVEVPVMSGCRRRTHVLKRKMRISSSPEVCEIPKESQSFSRNPITATDIEINEHCVEKNGIHNAKILAHDEPVASEKRTLETENNIALCMHKPGGNRDDKKDTPGTSKNHHNIRYKEDSVDTDGTYFVTPPTLTQKLRGATSDANLKQDKGTPRSSRLAGKEMCLDSETLTIIKKFCKNQTCIIKLDSDDDGDHAENFSRNVGKQNYVRDGVIKSKASNRLTYSNEFLAAKEKKAQSANLRHKLSQAEVDSIERKNKTKRTRHSTVRSSSGDEENRRKANVLNMSCIALRTRRKSMTAETLYKKSPLS